MIYWAMSTKTYRPWAPSQAYLLPPSPRDWLPEDHLAYFILDVVCESLDLSPIEAKMRAKDPRGNKPYAPQMMLALLIYAYCTGVFSSRKIERATYDHVGFRVIAGGLHPDHVCISEFRRVNLAEFEALFVQTVRLCRELGMLKLGMFALDGTKVKADASKHKAMSYAHMIKVEARLEEEIAELLERAELVDQAEDEVYGERGYEDLPAELHRREERLRRIREAKTALERGAREARASELDEQAERHEANAADESRTETDRRRSATLGRKRREKAAELREANANANDDDDDDEQDDGGLPFTDRPAADGDSQPDSESPDGPDGPQMPSHRVRHTADGEPHPSAQANFTDSESQIMEHQGGFIQGYNCQAVCDESGVMVAQGVTNVAPDTHHLPPMMGAAEENLDQKIEEAAADTGYWAPENAAYCEENGIDAYIATSRKPTRKADAESGTDSSGSDPPQRPVDQMRAKTSTPEGAEKYRKRKWIAEPPFGNIKENQGFRQFSLRGLDKVRGEWSLVTAAHNLRKAWIFTRRAAMV